jgi:fused signal recognition particle receptor
MAGFFKKLFNRITGRKEDEVQPVAMEQAALAAPEPESEPDVEVVLEPTVEPFSQAGFEPVPLDLEPPLAALIKNKPSKATPAKKAKIVAPSPKKAASPKPKPLVAKQVKEEPVAKRTAAKPKSEPQPKNTSKIKARKPEKDDVIAPVVSVRLPKPEPVLPPPVAVPESPEPELPPAVASVETPPPQPELTPAASPVFVTEKRRPLVIAKPRTAPPEPELETERKGWFSRLTKGLSKSSKSLTGSITAIFTKRKLDKDTLQDLEDTLIQADLGVAVSERIIKAVATGRYDKEIDPEEVKRILADEVARVLRPVETPFNFGEEKPFVILVVGVNGSGKTTTIGKLGSIASQEGFKVKFVACDTFRAAAIEQLTVWGKRIGAETMSRPQGADAAGLAFDAMKAAQSDGTDIMFIDTAGRLQNKTYLMDELDKVVRVIKKNDPKAPHAVLLVLDATTGQNALGQAEAFTKVAGVTGLIMTKLDGTARGGILVAIAEAYKLPIHAIGVGESIDDLQPFDAEGFARAIAGLEQQRI